jgi:hypothetical protein
MFFFEKKNQKTFAPLRASVAPAAPRLRIVMASRLLGGVAIQSFHKTNNLSKSSRNRHDPRH